MVCGYGDWFGVFGGFVVLLWCFCGFVVVVLGFLGWVCCGGGFGIFSDYGYFGFCYFGGFWGGVVCLGFGVGLDFCFGFGFSFGCYG